MSGLEDLTAEQRAYYAAGELLLKNPEVALEAKRLIKKVKPDVRFQDLETQDSIDASTKKLREDQEKLAESINKDRLERQFAEQRAKLRADGVDVEALEAFMKENELYSYEKAAKIYAQINHVAAPTPHSLMEDMNLPDAKAFWQDPVKAARAEAEKYFTERGILRRN
jgi:hypothetical protein